MLHRIQQVKPESQRAKGDRGGTKRD